MDRAMDRVEYELVGFKATEGEEQPGGLFAALVSVFGNRDRVGDRVMRGAFTKTLERWRALGKSIPVIWSHSHNDPDAYIGSVDPADVRETEKGLVVAGRIDIQDNPKARRIFELMNRGLIKEWSFAYAATKARMTREGVREVSELDLFEVGPTLVGANPATQTLALKALDLSVDVDTVVEEIEQIEAETEETEEPVETPEPATETKLDSIVIEEFSAFEGRVDAAIEEKIGRVISARTADRIRSALDQLQSVLVDAGIRPAPSDEEEPETETEEESETGETESTTEAAELVGAKAEEPAAAMTALNDAELLKLDLAGVGDFIAERSA